MDRDSKGTSAARSHDHGDVNRRGMRVEGVHLNASGDEGTNGNSHRSSWSQKPRLPDLLGTEVYPLELHALIAASEPAGRELAWDAFLAKHSRLMLHVARKVMPAPDSAMDAYAHLLERLHRDDCRVLAGYAPDGRSRFTTWLVVVTRRMCVDFLRQQYGRPRTPHPSDLAVIEQEARRRLVNFVGVEPTELQIIDGRTEGPEGVMRTDQLRAALDRAVATLPPQDQLLLRLRFNDELSAQKIAAVLKWPTPFHVYRKLKAVYDDLRRKLVAGGVEDSTP